MKRSALFQWLGRGLYLLSTLYVFYMLFVVLNRNVSFDLEGWVISGIVFIVPLSLGAFSLVRSVEEIHERRANVKIAIQILMGFYTIALLYILFIESNRGGSLAFGLDLMTRFKYDANIIPFKTIGNYIQGFRMGTMNKTIIYKNLAGNLILFLPCGLLLPLINIKFMNLKVLMLHMISIIIAIELIQFVTSLGSLDIDDVILNLLGVFIGSVIIRLNSVQHILKYFYLNSSKKIS